MGTLIMEVVFGEGGGGWWKCKAIWRIVCTSEKVLATPLRYANIERELLIAVYSCAKFCTYV